MELLAAAAPFIKELGTIGVLLVILFVQARRYDRLAAASETRVKEINDKRVEEARQSAKDADRHLELMGQMMQHVATSATAFQGAARLLDMAAQRLERLTDRVERPR